MNTLKSIRFLTAQILLILCVLNTKAQDSVEYVQFKLPSEFPTRIHIPDRKLFFDVYSTSQTETNWKNFKRIELMSKAEEDFKYVIAELIDLSQKNIEKIKSDSLTIVNLQTQNDLMFSKMQLMEEQFDLRNNDYLTCVSEVKRLNHKSFWNRFSNLGVGIFKVKYLALIGGTYLITKQFYK